MKTCDRLRAAILRSTESEASPAESLRVARHLDGCTACRIVAARARRLASALEALEDAVPLDDEAFLRDVMAALPSTPPAPAPGHLARRIAWIRRKRVDIAGIIALVLIAGASMAQMLPMTPAAGSTSLPRLAESPDGVSDAVSTLVALAGVALEGLGWEGRIASPFPDLGTASAAGLAMAGIAAAAAGAVTVATALRARLPIR